MVSTPKRQTLIFLAAALGGVPAARAADVSTFIYPSFETVSPAYEYYWRLLNAALARTADDFGPAVARSSSSFVNHQRAMDELLRGGIQVYVRGVLPPDYADRLDLVPIPLDKGLLGYRLFMIRKDTQPRLARVSTIADLRAFSFGQGTFWSDVAVLTHAQLKVVTSSSVEGLISMLINRRFDVFPRGVMEIGGEFERAKAAEPELAIEESVLLAYPLSFYFMVPRDAEGTKLKQRAFLGIQRMRADGSFDKLYQEFKRGALAGINLKGRKLIRIDNPTYVDPIYGAGEKGYWDDLAAELKS